MVTTTRPITAADWTRAAERAVAEGIAVRQLPTTGVWVASSGSADDVAYIVTPSGCECRGSSRGYACKHIACLRMKLGMLATPVAAVESVAVPVVEAVDCRDCLGTGYERMYTGYGLSDWIAVTCGCQKAVAA